MAKKKIHPAKLKLVNVRKGIYSWVKKTLEGEVDEGHVIWRDQSEPLPGRPCVTLKITSGPQRTGYSDGVSTNTDGTLSVGGHRTMIVSVQTFGDLNALQKVQQPTASQMALDLNSSLSLPTVLEYLRSFGISVHNQGEVTNVSELEETGFEDRAEFSMMIGVAENQLDDPGYFEEAGVPVGTFT